MEWWQCSAAVRVAEDLPNLKRFICILTVLLTVLLTVKCSQCFCWRLRVKWMTTNEEEFDTWQQIKSVYLHSRDRWCATGLGWVQLFLLSHWGLKLNCILTFVRYLIIVVFNIWLVMWSFTAWGNFVHDVVLGLCIYHLNGVKLNHLLVRLHSIRFPCVLEHLKK